MPPPGTRPSGCCLCSGARRGRLSSGLGGSRPERELTPGGRSQACAHFQSPDADRNSLPGLGRDVTCLLAPARQEKCVPRGPGSWLLGHVPVTPPSTAPNLSWQGTSAYARPASRLTVGKDTGGRACPRSRSPAGKWWAQRKKPGHMSQAVGHRAQACGSGDAAQRGGSARPPSPPPGAGAAACGLSGAGDKVSCHCGRDTACPPPAAKSPGTPGLRPPSSPLRDVLQSPE